MSKYRCEPGTSAAIPEYKQSPLGVALEGLLSDIQQIKSQYPESSKDSLELKHARTLVTLIESKITTIHCDILPKFDRREIPSLLVMPLLASNISSLMDYPKTLHTRKYALFLSVSERLKELIKSQFKSQASNPNFSMTGVVIRDFSHHTKSLFKQAEKIPGDDLTKLMGDMINQIVALDLDNTPHLDKEETLLHLESWLQYKLFTEPKENTTEFIIAHALTFQVINALLQRLIQAPQNLQELIPFFNPDSLPEIIKHSLISALLKGFLGLDISLERIKQENTPSYLYRLTAPRIVQDINVQESYDQSSMPLLLAMQTYFNRYHHTPHVQTELSKGGLQPILDKAPCVQRELLRTDRLQAFVAKETQQIEQLVTDFKDKLNNRETHVSSDPFKRIQDLEKEISRLDNLWQELLARQQLLQSFQENYNKAAVTDTSRPQESLADSSTSNYVNTSLPEEVIGRDLTTGKIALIPIKIQLEQLIANANHEFQELDKVINSNYQSLTLKIQQVMADWKEQQKLASVNAHNILSSELVDLHSAQHAIDQKRQALIAKNSLDIKVLESDLEWITQQNQALEVQKNQVESLKKTSLNHILIPPEAQHFAQIEVLQSELKNINQTFQMEADTCLKSILDTQKTLVRATETLTSRLQKARSDAKFAESMRSADPNTMRALLIKRNKILIKQQEERTRLEADIEAIATILPLWSSRLKQVLEDHNALSRQLSAVEETIHSHLGQINQYVKDYIPQHGSDGLAVIETCLQQYEERLRNSYSHPEELLQLILSVQTYLSQNSRDIPFRTIDTHLNDKFSKTNYRSFLALIDLLGLETSLDWADFRNRQYSVRKPKPSPSEYKNALSLLSSAIATKQAQLTSQIKTVELKTNLMSLKEVLCLGRNDHTKLATQMESNQKKQKTVQESYESNQSRLLENQTRLGQLSFEISQLEKSIEVLKNTLTISDGIETFRTDLIQLEECKRNFFSEDTLCATIMSLKHSSEALLGLFEPVSKAIDGLDQPQAFRAQLEGLQGMLSATQDRLAQAINTKAQSTINEVQESLAALSDLIQRLSKGLETLQASDLINAGILLASYETIPAFMQTIQQRIQQMEKVTQTLSIECLATGLLQQQAELNRVTDSLSLLSHQIEEKTHQIILHYQTSALSLQAQLQALTHTSCSANQAAVSTRLSQLAAAIDLFPSDETLNALGADKVAELKTLQTSVRQALQTQQAQNNHMFQRIQHRQNAIPGLIGKLTTYQTARAEAYPVKDLFFPGDYRDRVTFITGLTYLLTSYSASGNSQDVLNRVREGLTQFPGLQLKTILNQIYLEVLELDEPEEEVDLEPCHQQALSALYTLNQLSPEAIGTIHDLYQQISEPAFDASQVSEQLDPQNVFRRLTLSLRKDLDLFVLKHQASPPNQAQVDQFIQKCSARLHSQDATMSRHSAQWKVIAANFLIGLLTLGTLLLAQVIHSKRKTGRVAFFFEKTDNEEHIEQLERTVRTIAAPSA